MNPFQLRKVFKKYYDKELTFYFLNTDLGEVRRYSILLRQI